MALFISQVSDTDTVVECDGVVVWWCDGVVVLHDSSLLMRKGMYGVRKWTFWYVPEIVRV